MSRKAPSQGWVLYRSAFCLFMVFFSIFLLLPTKQFKQSVTIHLFGTFFADYILVEHEADRLGRKEIVRTVDGENEEVGKSHAHGAKIGAAPLIKSKLGSWISSQDPPKDIDSVELTVKVVKNKLDNSRKKGQSFIDKHIRPLLVRFSVCILRVWRCEKLKVGLKRIHKSR